MKVFVAKVKPMPELNCQRLRSTVFVPRLYSSTYSSFTSSLIGWYMISLMTMSRINSAPLVAPGLTAVSSWKPGAPSGGDAAGLPFELERIEYAGRAGIHQVDVAAPRAKPETEVRFIQGNKAAPRNLRSARHHELIRSWIIREDTAREIH